MYVKGRVLGLNNNIAKPNDTISKGENMKRRTQIQLTPYEDLFSTEEQRQDLCREKVMDIPLSELHPFKDHPFKVLDDDRIQ